MKLTVDVKTLPTFLEGQKEFSSADIDTVLDAKTPEQYSDLWLLFLKMAPSFYNDRDILETLSDNIESSSLESWVDIKDYQALLQKALDLKALTASTEIAKRHFEEVGIRIVKINGVMDHLSLSVPLEYGQSTYQFLNKGVEAAKKLGHFCYLQKFTGDQNHKSFSLVVNSCSWILDDDAGYQELYSKGCLDILNALNAIMLQELTLDWSDNKEIVLSAPSPASSLWCTMLATSQKYRVGHCIVCGKIFNAQDNGNRRKFCKPNSACTKKYQRLTDYIEFMVEGKSEADAAKAAHVKLEDAKHYWSDHPEDAKRVEEKARNKQSQTTNKQT